MQLQQVQKQGSLKEGSSLRRLSTAFIAPFVPDAEAAHRSKGAMRRPVCSLGSRQRPRASASPLAAHRALGPSSARRKAHTDYSDIEGMITLHGVLCAFLLALSMDLEKFVMPTEMRRADLFGAVAKEQGFREFVVAASQDSGEPLLTARRSAASRAAAHPAPLMPSVAASDTFVPTLPEAILLATPEGARLRHGRPRATPRATQPQAFAPPHACHAMLPLLAGS